MESREDSYVHTSNTENEISSFSSHNAVVFQCSKCESIVGDSMSWVSATKILRTITLGRVTSKVAVKKTLEISQSGADKGSTFYSVVCVSCNTILGKQYVASPPDLDHIRGAFTLDVNKLNSYEVDSGEQSGLPYSEGVTTQSLNETLVKMQFTIHVLEERIKKLEAQAILTDTVVNGPQDTERRAGALDTESESVSSSENALMVQGAYSTRQTGGKTLQTAAFASDSDADCQVVNSGRGYSDRRTSGIQNNSRNHKKDVEIRNFKKRMTRQNENGIHRGASEAEMESDRCVNTKLGSPVPNTSRAKSSQSSSGGLTPQRSKSLYEDSGETRMTSPRNKHQGGQNSRNEDIQDGDDFYESVSPRSSRRNESQIRSPPSDQGSRVKRKRMM